MTEHDKEPRLIQYRELVHLSWKMTKGKAAKAQLLVRDAIKLAVYAEALAARCR